MKKLALNKQIIARLNNPNNIYGGQPVTYNCGGVAELSKYFDADRGVTGCNSGPNTVCLPTEMWHCVSDHPTYCYNQTCYNPQVTGCASANTKC